MCKGSGSETGSTSRPKPEKYKAEKPKPEMYKPEKYKAKTSYKEKPSWSGVDG